MGQNSKIEWTDHTFNPWLGCTKIAPGCTHCYAEAFAKRYGKATWGVNGTRVKTSPAYWRKPLKWNRDAERAQRDYSDHAHRVAGDRQIPLDAPPSRPRVFCASLADVFEDWSGPLHSHDGLVLTDDDMRADEFNGHPLEMLRLDLFDLIDRTPHLDWLLLTKRPENIWKMWPARIHKGTTSAGEKIVVHGAYVHRPNVWLGTSIATQEDAEKNIPALLKCSDLVPVLFVSAEPLLGPVDLSEVLHDSDCYLGANGGDTCTCSEPREARIDWVIAGGESGAGARPCDTAWIASLVEQCQAAGVACFVKQLGARPIVNGNGMRFEDKKGGDWDVWPRALCVRQFPRPHTEVAT